MADHMHQLLQLLQHTQGPDPQAIKHAELKLKTAAHQAGYGCALAQIALASPEQAVPPHLRQLAAVLLKQYVRQHWVAGERSFEPPETSEQDKAQIRSTLPAGLRDPDSKIRTAIGMAIAAIANWDWPQAWPGLLEFIVGSIKGGSDPNLVAGCLCCLGMMAADLDTEQAPQLLQALSPELLALASSPSTPSSLSATCFNVMAELVAGLANLSGAFQRQARDVLVPAMQTWLPLVCGVLRSDPAVRSTWGPMVAALRLAQPLVTTFSKPLEASMPDLMGAAWQLLLAAQPLHQSILIEGTDAEHEHEAADGDEEPVNLEGLLATLFELLLSFIGPQRFRSHVESAIPQMVYVTVTYLQMTQDQAEAWANSANQFVLDEEEDTVSCRASSELLLSELADEFDAVALAAVLDAVSRRLSEADAAAAAGKSCWWMLREAGLVAVGACWEQLVQAVQCDTLPAQHINQFLDQLLQRDLQCLLQHQQQQQQQLGDTGHQFVLARALWVAARLQEVASLQQQQLLLQAAAQAVVSAAAGPPVRVAGYKALAALTPHAAKQQLAPLLPQLLPALVQQLVASDEDTLHLVLELLRAVIEDAAVPGSPSITPEQALSVAQPVLQVWLRHTSDPLIAPDAQDVISALASCPSCLPSLAAAAAPSLASIVERGAATRLAKREGRPAAAMAAALGAGLPEEAPMLVEASLDLLGAFVRPGQEAVTTELCGRVLGPVLSLIQASDDVSEVSSAVNLLLQLMRACPPQQLLAVGSTGGASSSNDETLTRLLAAARQLLAPREADGAVKLAGPLLAQMLKAFPAALAGPAPAALLSNGAAAAGAGASCLQLLLHDVVAKMASGSCSPMTVAHLLEFVVKLVLLDVNKVVELLETMKVQQPDGSVRSGLAVVLPLWLEHAPDMPGGLPTRQCAAALLQLLQLRHHPALTGLMVPGRPLEGHESHTGSGRMTRSKAKQQGGLKFSQVPVPAKVLQVLGLLLAADAESGSHKIPWAAGLEADWGDEDDDYESDEEGDAGGHQAESPLAGLDMQAGALRAAGLRSSDAAAVLEAMDRSAAATPTPDDPADAADPLMSVGMRSLLRQGLGALAAADPGFMAAAAAQLGPGRELQALQELLSSS